MPCPYEKCVVQELEIEPRPYAPGEFPGPPRHYYAVTRRSLAALDADGTIVGDTLWHSPASTPDLLKEAERVLGQQNPDLFNLGPSAEATASSTHSFGCADACDCVKRPNKVTLPYGKEVDLPFQELRSWPQRDSDPATDPNALTALVERRVTLSDGKTYLITLEVKFFGILRRFQGECRPRR